MINIKYISDFLTKVEGPRQTRGYVPCYLKTGGSANYRGDRVPDNYTAMGASGVTIATGCDLGQTDLNTLRGYGLKDEALLTKLGRYIGKKRDAALRVLYAYPLTITTEQAEALDHAVHGGYLKRYVIPAYDSASAVEFAALPDQAQAAIMSVCFQKGCGGVRRDWPKTWKYLTTQDWRMAAQELRTGFTQYKGRRTIEGNLLAELQGGSK